MMIEKEIDGIEIQIDNDSPEAMAFAESVARAYADKVADIGEYLSKDEGIRIFFNNPSKERIIVGLKQPKLRIFNSTGVLTYCDHDLDDIHIIDLEFDGVLENFLYVSIDG